MHAEQPIGVAALIALLNISEIPRRDHRNWFDMARHRSLGLLFPPTTTRISRAPEVICSHLLPRLGGRSPAWRPQTRCSILPDLRGRLENSTFTNPD
jgi:hypothetical protein